MATFQSVKLEYFYPVFYEQMHVVPNPIGLGAVTAPTQVSVYVWNAYPKSERTLSGVTELNATGLTLAAPT